MHHFESLVRRADRAEREGTDQLFSLLYPELHRLTEHSRRRADARARGLVIDDAPPRTQAWAAVRNHAH